ncbi:DUF6900 domain-containing protein [Paraburkholderia sp. EG304]|uniref:DUF6900 domain-containing protein n=1 Tax=Paraburkholderia sp. EG304 TaxID=3237015 RepID=UPI00397C8FA8
MSATSRNDPHWLALQAIAAETMALDSLEERGRTAADLRMVRVRDIASALEQAYWMGLNVGYNAELH